MSKTERNYEVIIEKLAELRGKARKFNKQSASNTEMEAITMAKKNFLQLLTQSNDFIKQFNENFDQPSSGEHSVPMDMEVAENMKKHYGHLLNVMKTIASNERIAETRLERKQFDETCIGWHNQFTKKYVQAVEFNKSLGSFKKESDCELTPEKDSTIYNFTFDSDPSTMQSDDIAACSSPYSV